jgi:hypothetical protein
MEREGESAEMVDYKGDEDDQQNRYEEPKQPPEEARHTASNAHAGQLPTNNQCMQAAERNRLFPPFPSVSRPTSRSPRTSAFRAHGTSAPVLRILGVRFGRDKPGQYWAPYANER